MLCPRCNSENDFGAKFCKFCGAPLTDSDLYKEKDALQKKKRHLKKNNSIKPRSQRQPRVTRKTYSLNEKAYRRSILGPIFSLIKSLIVLILIIIFVYFMAKILLVAIANNSNNYSIWGDSIPSVKYVVGDRKVKSIDYNYENKVLYKTYNFEESNNLANELTKYVGYLIQNNSYELLTDFNPSTASGKTILSSISSSEVESYNIIEISWNNNIFSITVYRNSDNNVVN